MRNFIILCISVLSIHLHTTAQQYRPMNSVQIYEQMKQLQHLTTVMYLAAHPDDENTRLLSYLTHERNYNTIYLSLTRGDGGQNLLGTHLGTGLGLIRNYELIAARQLDGAKQAFTSFVDFGFSKTPEETFKFWDKKALIDEVKTAIKMYRPDVIICRFPTDGRGGHGQHTASAIVALEAFQALEKEDYEHRPQRILFNAFKFGDRNTTHEDQFKLATNQYNPLIGESYGEMAGRSRSIHRSQGAGTPQSIGVQYEYFELMAGEPIQKDLIDKDLTWNRVRAPHIDTLLSNIIAQYDFTNPQTSIQQMIILRDEVAIIKDSYWRNTKLKDIDNIISSMIGFMAEVTTNVPAVVKGDTISLQINIIARNADVIISNIQIPGMPENTLSFPIILKNDTTFSWKGNYQIPTDMPVSEPYWLAQAPINHQYQYSKAYFSLPEQTPILSATIEWTIEGHTFNIQVPISYKYLHQVKGDVVQALRIEPELLIKANTDQYYYDLNDKNIQVPVLITNNTNWTSATLEVNIDKQTIISKNIPLPSPHKDSIYLIDIPIAKLQNIERNTLKFRLQAHNASYDRYQHKINYDHLPELVFYEQASMDIIAKVWEPISFKVGYIQGAGDKVMSSLKAMGLHVELIPDAMLNNVAYLNQYGAIIIGVRAYNTNEQLGRSKDALLQYMEQGGNLITQYNTHQPLVDKEFAPYPFKISRDRVTDETAEVSILAAKDPLLSQPNKILSRDFENWVQEFGLYFPADLDSRYKTLLSMNDPGESPLMNAIIYAPYGKGNYIYTGLSFFRQLPAGNVGAIKLFLNMLALGK